MEQMARTGEAAAQQAGDEAAPLSGVLAVEAEVGDDEEEDAVDEGAAQPTRALTTEEKFAEMPEEVSGLQACMICLLVKQFGQFHDSGCENCLWLDLEGNRQQCNNCLTPYFEGLISMMQPDRSWVSRWQGLRGLQPGCYAISATGGRLPAEVQDLLKAKGERRAAAVLRTPCPMRAPNPRVSSRVTLLALSRRYFSARKAAVVRCIGFAVEAQPDPFGRGVRNTFRSQRRQ